MEKTHNDEQQKYGISYEVVTIALYLKIFLTMFLHYSEL